MSETKKRKLPSITLREIEPHPQFNPLMQPGFVPIVARNKMVTVDQTLVDPESGELIAMHTITRREYVDQKRFVKIFADGIAAAYDLNLTARRVFDLVLAEYERTPMTNGYADSVTLYWQGKGIDGRPADMTHETYKRGLRTLIEKGFLYPKTRDTYWVAPKMFFKGNRIKFEKEFILEQNRIKDIQK